MPHLAIAPIVMSERGGMLLRRLSEHVKAQNWFAVVLDFAIVVLGVGLALGAQQCVEARNQKADYAQAMETLSQQYEGFYIYALEKDALRNCRRDNYRKLSALLMDVDNPWPGLPDFYNQEHKTGNAVKPILLSPTRPWTSEIYEPELNKGTLSLMDADQRSFLAILHSMGKLLAFHQGQHQELEARLTTLRLAKTLSPSDRLRYHDILMQADESQWQMESAVWQYIQTLRETDLIDGFATDDGLSDYIAGRNERQKAMHGECYIPLKLEDFVLPEEEGEATD